MKADIKICSQLVFGVFSTNICKEFGYNLLGWKFLPSEGICTQNICSSVISLDNACDYAGNT